MSSRRAALSFVAWVTLLASCTGPSSDGPDASSPNLRILLSDGPGGEADEVWIRWSAVRVHGAGGWTTIAQPGEVDLLSLRDGVVAQLASQRVEPGHYDQLRLDLEEAWVVNGGTREALTVPSADTSGVQLVVALDVPECGAVALTLDWDVGAHLTHAPGEGWILRPTLRLGSIAREGGGGLDVNGDGVIDLVAAGRTDPRASYRDARVLLGDGSGGFYSITSTVSPSVPRIHWPTSGAALGDVDGDGDDDVALADGYSELVTIHLGDASGLASEPSQVLRESPLGCTSATPAGSCFGGVVGAGDLDGDGRVDLAAFSKQQIYVYRGNERGFSTSSYVVRNPYYDGTIADGYGSAGDVVPDVNGDGVDDLVVGALYASDSHVLRGRAFVHYGSPSGASGTGIELAPPCAHDRCQWGSIATGDDFDGDGLGDVVLGARGERALALFRGGPSGISTTATSIAIDDLPIRAVPIGDFTGDGLPDLAVLTHSFGVEVLAGAPDGLSSTPIRIPTPGPIGTTECELVGLGDVDGDGRTDLATSQALVDGDGVPGAEGTIWIQLGRDSDASAPDLTIAGPSGVEGLSLIAHLGYAPVREERCR